MSFITDRIHRMSAPLHVMFSHVPVLKNALPRVRLLTRNELYVSLIILTLIGAIFLTGQSILMPVVHELSAYSDKMPMTADKYVGIQYGQQ